MSPQSVPPSLSASRAFLHVVYEHRCLATTTYSWNRVWPKGADDDDLRAARRVVPEISTPILESFLLHARNLVLFYCRSGSGTDITPGTFPLTAPLPTFPALHEYKDAIDVHLAHLTAWRDADYRRVHKHTALGSTRDRPDFEQKVNPISDLALEALAVVATRLPPAWSTAFQALHTACQARITPPGFDWPSELTEGGLPAYLNNLGIPW
jgi:hypothetical protein